MSIRFVADLDDSPAAPNLVEVGQRVLFATINGRVLPREIIDPDGSRVSIGIPQTA